MGGASRPPPPEALEPSVDPNQAALFGDAPVEPVSSRKPFQSIYVHFESPEDLEVFGLLVEQPISMGTSAIFFPAGDLKTRLSDLLPEPAASDSMILEEAE